ncbi:hypothetical protein [Serratia nevei]|uniref:hypothetical protein n=1 Tax=Serratia nevei TaxID=2703794 RepID=UPI00254E59D2|nr:hypothetical protein [Serratia nevei]MEC5616408.1 hypothetical protein [Serratia nevei]
MSPKLKRKHKAAFIFGDKHELQRKGLVLDVGFLRPLLVWRSYWIDEGYVMSEFKGTPGPWKVNVIGQHWNNKSLTHLEVTFGSDDECVCDTVYKIDDANLIAAAPKLLEARFVRQLKAARCACQRWRCSQLGIANQNQLRRGNDATK